MMIRVAALTKRYGSKEALTDVTFEVSPGEMFGFIGANGAGKSTTMRAIMGVLAPTSGEISWNGAPLTRQQRRRFGYMPEERGLYQKMKVADQIAYFGELYSMSPAAARRSADELIERLGLDAHRDDEVQALSLGNQQRAQLAVALVHSPELLVLDEPFSGLDPVGVDALADLLLERQRAGTPIIFSSHQLDLVERLITSVGIIDGGRMVAVGDVASVRRTFTEPRLRLRLSDPRDGWIERLPAAVVATEAHDTVLLDAGEADHATLLNAAMAEGTVEEFGPVHSTLAGIFRELVA